jgi:hypothetical protein
VNKLLIETLRKHGPIAVVMLMLAGLLVWSVKQAAEERANLFATQMDYIMDIREKIVAIERECKR